MGIGGGTGVGGGVQPPQIRDSETTAFTETTRKNVLGMIPSDTLEIIPFTQGEYDQVFKYRSEPDRPTLHPLLHLRHGTLPESADDNAWQPFYRGFVDMLPDEIRTQLLEQNQLPFAERDPGFAALDQLLIFSAIAVMWLIGVTGPVEAGSPEEINNALNLTLPYIVLGAIIAQAEIILNAAQIWLEQIGPNDPNYDSLVHVVGELTTLTAELSALWHEMEMGGDREALALRFQELAQKFHQLAATVANLGLSEGMLILKTTLDILAMVCSAWALGLDSSPLLIGMFTAGTGLSQETSETGVLGPGLQTVMNGLVEGLLEIFPFGPLTELEELDNLDQDIVKLRDA
ncbi:MAG: hypothetical protein WB791_04910 [Waddliaceae bacterium]